MSWTTNKASIVSILTANSYSELANNLNTNERTTSKTHKGYSLKPVEIETQFLTNNSTLSAHIAELEVSYIVKDNTDFDTQFDAWITLLNAIKNYHLGYAESPSFERDANNNKNAIGRVLLYVGAEGC